MTYLLPILAVLFSYAFVLLVKQKQKDTFKLLLAFSGAFLLALTVFELLPEVYQKTNAKELGIYIMIGILVQIFLEFFSKGAEHGHMHVQAHKGRIPVVLFISLSLHALLEGIPIEQHQTLLYGILIHKVPIALILSAFLVGSKIRPFYSFLFILLFSFMTPLGSYIAAHSELLIPYYTELTALVIGVLLHISTVILFESSEGHSFNLGKLLVILLGMVVAYFL